MHHVTNALPTAQQSDNNNKYTATKSKYATTRNRNLNTLKRVLRGSHTTLIPRTRLHAQIIEPTQPLYIKIQQLQLIYYQLQQENNMKTPCLPQNTPKTDFPTLDDTIPAPKRGAPLSTTTPTPPLDPFHSKNATGALQTHIYIGGNKIGKMS